MTGVSSRSCSGVPRRPACIELVALRPRWNNVAHAERDDHRSGERRVHDRRAPRTSRRSTISRTSRSCSTTSTRHGWRPPACWRPHQRGEGRAGHDRDAAGPSEGARRRELRHQRDPGRRTRRVPDRLRDPESVRRASTIADTLGIGGISRGLRTLPVMIDIANDMADVCPDATLLNFTNPMAMVPWAVYEGSRFDRVVGLCHSVSTPTSSWPRRSACRWTRSRSRRRASTTRRSSRGSSTTARTSTRRSMLRSMPTPKGWSPGPGPALQGTGVLPDRVQRALRGIRVVVHAPRRSDRAVPHPGRRLHRTHRRGVGGLSRDRAQARGG